MKEQSILNEIEKLGFKARRKRSGGWVLLDEDLNLIHFIGNEKPEYCLPRFISLLHKRGVSKPKDDFITSLKEVMRKDCLRFRLELQMQGFVESEDYEKAAELRDQIKEIEL